MTHNRSLARTTTAGLLLVAAFAAAAAMAMAAPGPQQVSREPVEGIRNLARIETTVACAGAITAEAIPAIKQMGFVSIINLRRASEEGADVDAQRAAAEAIGLRYFHVPYDGSADPAAAEAFLRAVTAEGAEPAFIHCAGGNRASTMWLIKRIAVDGWDVEKATAEAVALGQTNAAARQFAIEYAQAHRRVR
jgi:uncharacterized protein (TIGR01244 family)